MSPIQRGFSLLAILSICTITGCPMAPSANEEFDAAKKAFDKEQAELDRLLPGYTAAKQTALASVTKELTGATAEEAAAGALGQLDSMSKALKEGQGDADIKPGGFEAIDRLAAKQDDTMKQLNAIAAAAGKTNEVLKNIHTPGTPEAKRYEETLAALPEVQAYDRQKQRLDRAKKAMEKAEAKLTK